MRNFLEEVHWIYRFYVQEYVTTFISAGLTTAAIVLVLRYFNVLA